MPHLLDKRLNNGMKRIRQLAQTTTHNEENQNDRPDGLNETNMLRTLGGKLCVMRGTVDGTMRMTF